jgi:hypothetical protein
MYSKVGVTRSEVVDGVHLPFPPNSPQLSDTDSKVDDEP